MAQFAIQRKAESVIALLGLVSVLLMIGYAVIAHAHLGWAPYLLSLATAVVAWIAKEDSIVIAIVMVLSILVMLDVTLYIGVIGPYGH